MKKTGIVLMGVAAMLVLGCGYTSAAEKETEAVTEVITEAASDIACELEDGEYQAEFDTDSGMFHVNEACEDKGILTVKDGKMTIHVSLAGKGILNLYVGLAKDAEEDEENWLQPTEDEVTYKDGYKETVYGFDIPVEKLEEEFNVALIGKKDKWYDHKVKITNVTPAE